MQKKVCDSRKFNIRTGFRQTGPARDARWHKVTFTNDFLALTGLKETLILVLLHIQDIT